MTEKAVSIITPAYNCEKYIARTIECVISQSYKNWEMIIVDDYSGDNTEKVVLEFCQKDERIKYHKFESNQGTGAARTKAMDLAKGVYIAFLDSDDLWDEHKLAKQIAWMEENDYAITCTSYEHIDENDKPLKKVIRSIPKTDYNRLLLDCPVGNSSVIYNAEKLGKFIVPNIKRRNDDALWLQMLKKEKYIYGMNEILMQYRVRRDSVSSNKLQLIKYHWILYRDIEHLGFFRSLFHVCYWCVIKVLGIK